LPVAAAPSKQVNVSKAVGGGGWPGCCGIKWLGVPLALATWEGACFDRAFALRVAACVGFAAAAGRPRSLPEALAKAYQTNPQLNAERARQRATDENVPQALAGYRPQIVASLSAACRRSATCCPTTPFSPRP
jgi:hypothetical protein